MENYPLSFLGTVSGAALALFFTVTRVSKFVVKLRIF